MSKRYDGGPAFPTREFRAGKYLGKYELPSGEKIDQHEYDRWVEIPGMALRDWFAGQALAGYIANPTVQEASETKDAYELSAEFSYSWADAMLKARQS